ncbi:LuxR C-terminal-related transcriptional regulator [Hoyosella sp. YIM 151337]|uniref:response regulator transcription factor n=1 Tax=Hoyosella sp. YIM 151337 TaxID=2992742 RepID=UPI0022354F10|nr:LuxR C-terminal-related transcriptional regulator [Hoyosella sp. YIM 151337]MCW4354217.1 LuxR C-terminal-related transcriptional regulator [Hoyosella sp. YIM 151337]
MASQARGIFRIGLVEDHSTYALGLAALLSNEPDLELVAIAQTANELIENCTDLDLVVLDLRLADGSSPRANVVALHEHGINVLVLTSGDDTYLIRSAARGGVLGVVLKSEAPSVALDAIREAAAGRTVATMDWAAAIDSDPGLSEVQLTDRQREVLALYAAGEKASSVARRTNLSVETVNDYVGRIRRKYAEAGRPAPTKMDLYKRALEDGWLPLPRRHDGRGRSSTSDGRGAN